MANYTFSVTKTHINIHIREKYLNGVTNYILVRRGITLICFVLHYLFNGAS